MKNIQNKLIVFFFIAFSFSHFGSSQDSFTDELNYEVNKIYPYISVTKEKLNQAHTIGDFKNETNNLNLEYKPSWVREYISVEISTTYKGVVRKAVSQNEVLTAEQKDLMNRADVGKDISVKVRYIPENTLTDNDIKETRFSFTVAPESDAKYLGGQQELKRYLKGKVMDKIPSASFKGYDLAVIKFTISEEGEITNAHIFGSEYRTSKDEKTDKLLLETIQDMPCWKPAEYANGTKVKQEFVLTVGNMKSCIVPLLNIK